MRHDPQEPNAIDRELAFFLDRLSLGTGLDAADEGEGNAFDFRDLVTRLHTHLRQGHVCLTLDDAIASDALLAHPMIGRPEDSLPLVLEGNRLTLRRYDRYEREIADAVLARLAAQAPSKKTGQQLAIERATTTRFLVVSGGPGTGKTYVVARLLERIFKAKPEARIRLAAPTGKAAARMKEEVEEALAPDLRSRLPADGAGTIHRLLAFPRLSTLPRHNRERKLALDVLVIDEASMVDLALLAKVVRALPDNAQLILLGDKDQLASVESGAVLAELCAAAERNAELAGQIVMLTENRRFGEDSGIGQLAEAIRAGDANRAGDVLDDPGFPDAIRSTASLADLIDEHLRPLHASQTPEEAFEAFGRFQFLCATRRDPENGLEIVNEFAARQLGIEPGKTWYHGRPVLVRRNAYPLRLFNGDIGIALQQADGVVRVAFPDPSDPGHFRWLHPSRLPEHETAYAMTVHKSQGAQFGHVVVLLPGDDSPLLTRELVYTAITRARNAVEIRGGDALFTKAIKTPTVRHSGLGAKLG